MKRSATLDFLFPMSLFTIFIIVASLLLAISIRGYHNVEQSGEQQNDILVSAYITTKIRSFNDGNISMRNIDGVDCLMLDETIKNEEYTTYLYFQDDSLKELLMRSNLPIDLKDGTNVLKLKGYHMKLDDNQFEFSYQSVLGKSITQKITLMNQE
ncbi:MAG: DUF4860 domain-containing protein [Erysipelotrichaceae bacterium]